MREDVGLELKRATNRAGVDAAIETSGNEQALQQALRGLGYGGTIAFVGWARAFSGTLDLGREAHFNNANLVFSRASSEPSRDHPRWDRRRIATSCWSMLASGEIDCERIVDPVVSFAEAPAHTRSTWTATHRTASSSASLLSEGTIRMCRQRDLGQSLSWIATQ